ncbi:MAG: redoxin domain-containing protein [Pirellulales bacterium]|nr:redoxin domain-containing protein [Pirellulales bacterium]
MSVRGNSVNRSRKLHAAEIIGLGVALIALYVVVPFAPQAGAQQTPTDDSRAAVAAPRKIEDFRLPDFRGHEHALADAATSRLIVVAFLGVECPLAKLYAPRLQALDEEYHPRGVAFLAIDSNQQDSLTELAAFARTHGLTMPVLKDAGNVVADQFGAERTPEVFVLDAQRMIRYRGRIDDQYGFANSGVAFQRDKPVRRDLAEAIDELLSDKPVSQPSTAAPGCLIGRVRKPDPTSEVTYANQISRLLNRHCVSCHRPGQIAPFSLTSYDDAVGWSEMIGEVVARRRMPPWHADPSYGHFANEARLSDEEMAQVRAWVDAGAPQGDPSQTPPLPEFTPGWFIPQPDEVLFMRDEPFDVPAEGTVPYQRFVVDPGWKEDRWIKAIEPRPGNPSVAHHIVIYLATPRGPRTGPAGRIKNALLTATAPGVRPHIWEDGLAQYIPAGSKLIFEMHYTPNGTAQQDRSCAGIIFADPKSVRKEVAVQVAGNTTFAIPPGDGNYQIESFYPFRQDSLILSMSPHAHLRGKDFRYDLVLPDGRVETLLSVPQYDFGWQTTYVLAEPKLAPRGSKLHCTAHYDNSPENPSNPDATQLVRFGEQTWEEMMFGWFDMALVDQDLQQPQTTLTRAAEFAQRVKDGTVGLDDEMRAVARQALRSPEAFELFCTRLQDLLPQLDRVCVTWLDKDKLRVLQACEPTELKTPLRTAGSFAFAEGEALATYGAATAPHVHADLAQLDGSLAKRFAHKGLASSAHVPLSSDGVGYSVNFWSTERDAFSPAAVELLASLVREMAGDF